MHRPLSGMTTNKPLLAGVIACFKTFAITLLLSACGPVDNERPPLAVSPPTAGTAVSSATGQRPNILLIVADDVGFADLGVYGSEIKTPNLDRLAREGVAFSQFYSSPMCSPSRAMLLSGVDSHLAGLGNMAERLAANQRGHSGYEGHINARVATLAEVLGAAGYRTYMTGKWHLGSAADGADPAQRGFDKTFALLDSGAGAFDNRLPTMGPGKAEYSENGELLASLPKDFYSTRFYAEKMIAFLENDEHDERPFFAYLAFTAAHFPLQAPADSIARYRGAYDQGYDVLHARRLLRMQELGLLPDDVKSFPRSLSEPAWETLSTTDKAIEARRMEIYAAMIGDLDHYVGKLIDFLKANGQYDNTVIFFMSDNGAEGHWLSQGLKPLEGWAKQCCNNSYENMGKADSYLMLGPNWARAANAPFRMFKGFTSEGGVRVPAFIRYPAMIGGGKWTPAQAMVTDVMPTLLELAGVEHPGKDNGERGPLPMQGRSMLSMLSGETDTVHADNDIFGWELFGKRAVRNGDWKIIWETGFVNWWASADLGIKREQWQLYNLAIDPAELVDLSASEPRQLKRMIGLWEHYARVNNVILPDTARGY